MKKHSQYKVRRRLHYRERKRAMALVAIVVLGAFAIAVMMTMYQLAINVVRSEVSYKTAAELRNAAEIGVDYAVQQLNNSIETGDPCAIDKTISDLPSSLLPDSTNLTVRINVREIGATEWGNFAAYSAIYSVALDASKGPGAGVQARNYDDVTRTNVKTNYWRVVESTARKGGFARSIKVYLQPRFDKPPGAADFRVTGSTSASYFSSPMLGNSLLNMSPTSGNLTVTGGADVLTEDGTVKYKFGAQTNRLAVVGDNTAIQGDLRITNNKAGAPSSVAQYASPSNSSLIAGRVESNSEIDSGFKWTLGSSANPALDSVVANADSVSSGIPSSPRVGLNSTAPVSSTELSSQAAPAPVMTDSSAIALPDVTSVSSLSSGSYYTSSLSTGGNSVTTTGGVRIFVQDGASSDAAVDLSTSTFINSGSPEQLQIWYSGTRAVNLNLDADFKGVIYAPNAPVTLTGSKDFSGALVADKLNLLNSGTVNVSNSLSSGGSPGDGSPAGSVSYWTNAQGETLVQGYKVVGWHEYSRAIVPGP